MNDLSIGATPRVLQALRGRLLLLAAAAVLASCASTPPEATVQVFTGQQQQLAGSSYRFERLPSQAMQPGQAELEAAADGLLARNGLRRDDAGAKVSVQLAAIQDRPAYGGVMGGPSVGLGVGAGSFGSGIGIGLGFPIGGRAAPASQRVDVVVREVGSGRVLFQSQASGSSGAGSVALLEAALRDFPNAPRGTRQVPLAGSMAR